MSIKEALVHKFELPADVFLNAMVIEMTGRYEMVVRNFRQVKEYEDTNIRISGKNQMVCICGKRLEIDYYEKSELHIIGCIQSVTLE